MLTVATYKLIQDIEAEDHILGPLTLRQFIFALVAAFFLYLSFISFVKHAYFLLLFLVPPALFCLFFAVPFGRDQPTEVWALAKIRFWFKPRRRLWDQTGIKELVTITAPKKVEVVRTDGLSKNEVESRLKALANTLDTRGWAIKNSNLSAAAPGGPLNQSGSDRLLDIGVAPAEVPAYDVQASDDILDETTNPVAQQMSSMINKSSQTHRQQLMDELNNIRAGEAAKQAAPQPAQQSNLWFVSQGGGGQAAAPTAASLPAAPDDATLSAQLRAQKSSPAAYAHLRTLQPGGPDQPVAAQAAAGAATIAQTGASSGAANPDPAILSLANNNDLNVSTLAREAHKAKNDDESAQDEVVISLR